MPLFWQHFEMLRMTAERRFSVAVQALILYVGGGKNLIVNKLVNDIYKKDRNHVCTRRDFCQKNLFFDSNATHPSAKPRLTEELPHTQEACGEIFTSSHDRL